MRTDAIGPRTWLLAALAGWALLVGVLALFGMGGRIRPLPDDPGLVTRLPELSAAVPERLGPFAQYAGIGTRPLFAPDRQPQPFLIGSEAGDVQAQASDFVLSSVLITPSLRLAIVQPAQGGEGIRLKVGEAPPAAPAWRVVAINPRSVVFNGPEGERTLELRVFDGDGGQRASAPTANAAPSARDPTPPAAGGSTSSRPIQTSPGPSASSAVMETAEPVLSTEQQMDAIRKRIEARRAQLRAQGESPTPPNKTK